MEFAAELHDQHDHDHHQLQDQEHLLLLVGSASSSSTSSLSTTTTTTTQPLIKFNGNTSTTSSLSTPANPFLQIYPTTNISNLLNIDNPHYCSSSSLGMMNLQANLDLWTTQPLPPHNNNNDYNNIGLFKQCPAPSIDHLAHSHQESVPLHNKPSYITNKISSFMNGGVTETKRCSSSSSSSNSSSEKPKASHHQVATKKARTESRSSFSPFKIRKEKLGDRIAALQQLVAPFGKTDTASVLMEAIGYIKFLQDQVETLSVPSYMKSLSNNFTLYSCEGGVNKEEGSIEEPRRDLRSRGLCLVPLSCISYVTNDDGDVWTVPNFS